jgi:hypothetical protein
MMPADYTAGPAILPEMPAAGSAKFSGPLPAGAAPEDVRHWFDLETIVDLPAPVAGFVDAAEAAAQYRRASRSENTRRAYRAAVARFTGWCAVHGRTALPASPETVAAFLAGEARSNLAVNTLRLRHATIRYLHLLAGYPPPTAAAVVSATFAGIKRTHCRPLDKKTALSTGCFPPSRRSPRRCPDCATGRCCSSGLPRLCGRARSPGSCSRT